MNIKDPIILGFTSGLFGTLGDQMIHYSSLWLKIVQSTTGHYISQLIFPYQKVTLPILLIGEFTHFLAGGILGIAIVLILKLSGYDFAIWKGLGLGTVLWIVHVLVIPNLVAPRPFLYRTFNEVIIDFVSHIVWSYLTVWFVLFNQRKAINN